jgi:hypothetical protein
LATIINFILIHPFTAGIFRTAFIISLFISISCFGQSTFSVQLQHISEENGLSDNHVQCIYKDNNELLWVGTLAGLNLVDGSAITIFKHDATASNSIIDNNINTISSGKNGLIWIGTPHGLNSLNPFTRKVTRYHLPKNTLGENKFITSIAAGRSGTIIIGTPNGLFYLQNEKFYRSFFPGIKIIFKKITGSQILRSTMRVSFGFPLIRVYGITTYKLKKLYR